MTHGFKIALPLSTGFKSKINVLFYRTQDGEAPEMTGLEPVLYIDLFPRTDKSCNNPVDMFPRTENTHKNYYRPIPANEKQ